MSNKNAMTDDEIAEIAQQVSKHLHNSGQRTIGDKILLSRREALAVATGSLTLGALGVSMADPVEAQTASGQVGTSSNPVDVIGGLGEFDTLENDSYFEEPATIDPASGTTDIDLAVSNWYQPIAATGDLTITFSNVSTTPPGNSLTLFFTDGDGSGSHAISWPASVRWSGGTVADTIKANSTLRVTLTSADGGSTWDAAVAGSGFA